jgi:hypothetical protein
MRAVVENLIFALCRALKCSRYMDASHLKDNEVIECCVGDDVEYIICIFK